MSLVNSYKFKIIDVLLYSITTEWLLTGFENTATSICINDLLSELLRNNMLQMLYTRHDIQGNSQLVLL